MSSFVTETDSYEENGPLCAIPLKSTLPDELYRYLLYTYESSRNIIKSYNYFIDVILPNIFIGEYEIQSGPGSPNGVGITPNVWFPIIHKNGVIEKINPRVDRKYVTDVIVEYPIIGKNNIEERITPRMARAFGVSYMSKIYLKVQTYNFLQNAWLAENQYIGSIPTMVGSNRCYTSTKPEEFTTLDDWKVYCGECPSLIGGYFINKGAEKAIIHQEKLRTCNYFTSKTKDAFPRILTQITCISKSETTIVRLKSGKIKPTVKVLLPHTKGKHYPFYLTIYFMYKKYTENIQSPFEDFGKVIVAINQIIISFVPYEERDSILIALRPSITKFEKIAYEVVGQGTVIRPEKVYLYALKKAKDLPKETTNIKLIYDSVYTECFNSAPTIEGKIVNLCFMVAQHLRSFLKKRPLDSKDSWMNKKIDTPARLIELLTNQIFNELKKNPSFKLTAGENTMEKTFKSSFNSYQWGVGKNQKKENVAEALKNDTMLSINSQCAKINTPVDARIKNFNVRGVQPTQMGIICPAETPEGGPCGLVKHLSGTTNISYNRIYEEDRKKLMNTLLYEMSDFMTSFSQGFECKYTLFINEVQIGSNDGFPLFVSERFVKRFPVTKFEKDRAVIQVQDLSGTYVEVPHWSGKKIIVPREIPENVYGLFQVINQFFATIQQKPYMFSFTINGDVLIFPETSQFTPTVIWINPDPLVLYLKNQRRDKKLPRDCCIYKSESVVQYFDDGGRGMAPFLIVDKDGDLIADKLGLWNMIQRSDYQNAEMYIEKFFESGAIELIDVKEYEAMFLAETIEEVRAFSTLRKFLDRVLPPSITFIEDNRTVFKTIKNVDPRECDNYIAALRIDYHALLLLNGNQFPENNKQEKTKEQIGDQVKQVIITPELQEFRNLKSVQFLKEKYPFLIDEEIFYKIYGYLMTRFKFTHSFVNPNSMFSGISNLAPKADSEQGPRFTYQASMSKQALSNGNILADTRFDTSSKRQMAPTRSNFETIADQPLGINTLPITETTIMMTGAHCNGYEDPVIMSKKYAELMMRYEKTQTFKTAELGETGDKDNRYREIIMKPSEKVMNFKNVDRFRHLDANGLPRLGSIILEGDCVIGKIRRAIPSVSSIASTINNEVNVSIYAGVGEVGEVEAIFISYNEESGENYRVVTVKIVQRRFQIVGDKLASRYAQKGTIGRVVGQGDMDIIGRIIDENEMPYVRGGPNHGLKPDLIFNPAGIPTRMTCGKIFEIQTSKAALQTQERVNSSNFAPLDMDHYSSILYDFGMDKYGNEFISHSDGEIMMDSTTGKEFKAFIGPCSYQVLRHQVKDKIQARAIGKNDPLTRQPVGGRYNHGGLRLGEMERDALIAHGGSNLLIERLLKSSDDFSTTYCKTCQQLSADSPLTSGTCRICDSPNGLVNVTHPRVFLIFTNIMNAMGINVEAFLKEKNDS